MSAPAAGNSSRPTPIAPNSDVVPIEMVSVLSGLFGIEFSRHKFPELEGVGFKRGLESQIPVSWRFRAQEALTTYYRGTVPFISCYTRVWKTYAPGMSVANHLFHRNYVACYFARHAQTVQYSYRMNFARRVAERVYKSDSLLLKRVLGEESWRKWVEFRGYGINGEDSIMNWVCNELEYTMQSTARTFVDLSMESSSSTSTMTKEAKKEADAWLNEAFEKIQTWQDAVLTPPTEIKATKSCQGGICEDCGGRHYGGMVVDDFEEDDEESFMSDEDDLLDEYGIWADGGSDSDYDLWF